MTMTDDTWGKLHSIYKEQDWITKPSIFAETAITYFPDKGKLLELGAGLGQDSLFFAKHGYEITATDLNIDNLNDNKELHQQNATISVQRVDLRGPLPFENNSFNVVYAHLSLHYFGAAKTYEIFKEINRVLKPSGTFAFLANSTNDPENGAGQQIEQDYYKIEGVAKRYLSIEAAADFAQAFKTLLLDDNGETYKDSAKGVHNLIRYIGVKKN